MSVSLSGSSTVASGSSFFSDSLSKEQLAKDLLALLEKGYGSSSVADSSYNTDGLSQVEMSILRSNNPIEINESEELSVLGQRGIWMNKNEVNSWKGDLPINEYKIHEDTNPQIVNKKVQQQIEYVQELAIRYLRPPTPPAPGEIVITMEPNYATGPAPPLIIRQQPARPATPEPLVVREAPPRAPSPVGSKRITISGKRIPPPPRKVVIERLAALPSKPQNVIIERWLPYSEVKRRVIFNKPTRPDPIVATPRNVIVQWEAPDVKVRQVVKYLGVVRADPSEYVKRYGSSLKNHSNLPQFVLDIETPREYGTLAANHRANSLIELEGQLEGFQYVNLDSEGLGEYRSYLMAKGVYDLGAASASASSASASSGSASSEMIAAVSQVFELLDVDQLGTVRVKEAEAAILGLNIKLNRSYAQNDVKRFFEKMSGGSEYITKKQFVNGYLGLIE